MATPARATTRSWAYLALKGEPTMAIGDELRAPNEAILLDFVRPREAAAMLRLSVRTLEGYRFMGIGPAYYRFANRAVYSRADLARWAAARRYRTTAEADAN